MAHDPSQSALMADRLFREGTFTSQTITWWRTCFSVCFDASRVKAWRHLRASLRSFRGLWFA
eukprot:scaffold2117_cov241-Pinguiococcus_pyrenoidosus.AAC.7